MIGVYGANGFIGRHILSRFAGNTPIRAVSRSFGTDIRDKSGVEFLEADIRDTLAMASSLEGVDTVVQLISSSSPGLQNRYNVSDIRDNVIPHVEFLKSAIDAGVGRYIFISSGGTVYGPEAKVPISEDAPTNPINSHGLTKLMIEKYLQMHGYVDGLNYIILRVSNPFGPGQVFRKGQGLIPAVLARWSEGHAVRIFGDGSTIRDYMYIDDLVDAIELAATGSDVARTIINIGSGKGRSVLDVIEAMQGILETEFKLEFADSRSTDVPANVLSIKKAQQILGWKPKTDFIDGLKETLAQTGK